MNLDCFRKRIEQEIRCSIETWGKKTLLRDACFYALTTGGKRLRPLIALITAEAIGKGLDPIDAALSVEFFHTASLIADDLPCMDNDDVRRALPSLHKVYGESVALLASYTLIAEGYGGIYRNGERMRPHLGADEAVRICLETATRCAGIQGATQGQFFDLFPPDSSWETLKKIVYLKTVTLFEISFVFGWLFGGGDVSMVSALRECAYHFGLAFQIADDLEDGGRCSALCGKEAALSLLDKSKENLKRALQEAGLWTTHFQELYETVFLRGAVVFSSSLLSGNVSS